MIETFTIVGGGIAVLSIGGRYGQFPVYRRGTEAFAEVKGSYVKLSASRRTSVPSILWHDVEAAGLGINRLGTPAFSDIGAGRIAA